MTKKDLMKILRGLPDNTQIVIQDSDTNWFLEAKKIAVEKRARIKKVILSSRKYYYVMEKTKLLDKAKVVYFERDPIFDEPED